MAYIRYKEVAKNFNFTKALDLDSIPSYIKDYVYDDEILLAVYKVGKDHGIITDKKLVLFDNSLSFGTKKEITIIPYRCVTAHSVIFHPTSAEIYLLLETSNPLLLKFVDMNDSDKFRLRLLYNVMSASICGQKIPNQVLKKLINNDFSFSK
ncbi:MAG: PH domain-containing protein [Bacilli bacterium]|nr:PH domain-containing protein [Bacilli bacterium]